MSDYVNDLMAQVKEKNPAQPEFHQAVQEVAESLAVVLDKHPQYRKAKILEVDVEKERISLGIKQLTDDPYAGSIESIRKGDVVTCSITKVVDNGIEVMVGATEDPVFGSLVAFGLGGIHVEVLGDVVFRVAPITDQDAADMLGGIRGRKLLEGYRGKPAADEEAIRDVLLRISQLVDEVPEIDDLDINPVLAMPPGQGCCILDARIHVKSP